MSALARNIDLLLAQPGIASLVGTYFRPDEPFAGHLFDTVGENPAHRFTEGDLLAVSLLDVAFGPPAVERILGDDERWSRSLGEIADTTPLWEMDQRTYDAADGLWRDLVALPGVGPTKAGKLLARKRPHLIPIYDGVVNAFLAPGQAGLWWELHAALEDHERRRRVDDLGAEVEPRRSTLRILDVAIWMRCSDSTNARQARATNGVPAEPLVRP